MELLIVVRGNGNAAKAGHVIHAAPAGWPWSARERGNPNWRIVTADLAEVEADALLAADSHINTDDAPGWRTNALDVSDLPDHLTRAEIYKRLKP